MNISNCDRCYKRKGRCDKQQPCATCARARVSCVYTDRSKERRYPADHVERLERRLRDVESRNRVLVDELRKARSDESKDAGNRHLSRASPTTTRTTDAISEVSFLSITAAGERQPYLGSTSGVLFASLVRNSVDVPRSRHNSPPLDHLDHGSDLPAVTSTTPRRLEDLPSQALANRLFTAYLDHDATLYPFLAPSVLLDTVGKLYADQLYYTARASAFEVFVFHMILAISTTHCFKHDWHMLPGAELHHACAMKELDLVMAAGGISSLQAILLLCQYRTGSSVKDNSASMWHLVGIASRSCLELGLHKEAMYPVQPSQNLESDKADVYRKREIGRRCFWSVIAMDRICSQILGRPLAIHDEDIDTLLPDSDHDTIVTSPLACTLSGVSRIGIFNHIIRYRLFCGKLQSTLHRKRSPDVTVTDVMNIRDGLAGELEQWHDDLRSLGLPTSTETAAREQSCTLSKVWYEGEKCSLRQDRTACLALRPCRLFETETPADHLVLLFRSVVRKRRTNDLAAFAFTSGGCERSTDASEDIGVGDSCGEHTYSALHKSRQINYSWVTLQSVFMAGLSSIYAVSRHMREARQPLTSEACLLSRDPSTIEVVNVTRACSNVLVAVAERWSALRHCHEVFDKLSDAVLADTIKLQTMPKTVQEAPYPQSATLQNTEESRFERLTDDSQASQQYWNSGGQATSAYPVNVHTSPLAVDNAFLHCFDDLQQLYDQQQLEDPVMHLSQDWLAYLGGTAYPNDYSNQYLGTMAPID